MFGKASKKSVLGLDIGSHATKIVQLGFTGDDRPTLTAASLIDTGYADEGFSGNMKSYITENRLNRAQVAVSIDHDSMKIRNMELPKMPEADTIEAIKWKIRDIVEGDIDEYAISFSKISESDNMENPVTEIVAYAVKKEAVQTLKFSLEKLGLVPFFIEPASVTLASTLERCYPDQDRFIAGLDIGWKQTLFYVVGKGVFTFSRPLRDINLEVQQKDPENFAKLVAIELQKSIDTFAVNFKMQHISQVYLSGGGALIPGLAEYLQTNMGLEVAQLNPFKSVNVQDDMEGVKPELFAQAVGLAYLQP